jgi:hypothetical protein
MEVFIAIGIASLLSLFGYAIWQSSPMEDCYRKCKRDRRREELMNLLTEGGGYRNLREFVSGMIEYDKKKQSYEALQSVKQYVDSTSSTRKSRRTKK